MSALCKLSTYPVVANSVLSINSVGIPFDFAISKTPAPGTLHTISDILIGEDPFSKYSMIFFALDPAPEANIAT